MNKEKITWRNAPLPQNTAVFAIGDIHAQDGLLGKLLEGIEAKIAQLPKSTQIEIVFIGDYLDRGLRARETVELLIAFRQRMQHHPHVATHFLCGNHDEVLQRALTAPSVSDTILGDPNNPRDHRHCRSDTDGAFPIKGLEAWMFTGGGLETIKSYLPDLDPALFTTDEHGNPNGFNRAHADCNPQGIHRLLQRVNAAMPEEHRAFFKEVYDNNHFICGDYLFTHAGIDPDKTLAEQGIGQGAQRPQGRDYLDWLMIRKPFLERDDLPNCPYVVVHGHTPSEIMAGNARIADGRKDYRLCIDTGVYKDDAALTCFMRENGAPPRFLAVTKTAPDRVQEYDLPEAEIQIHPRLIPLKKVGGWSR